MRFYKRIPEEETKRNTLCVRCDDAEHEMIAEYCYLNRRSCSEFLRSMAVEFIANEASSNMGANK